jgi:hypothetical protein
MVGALFEFRLRPGSGGLGLESERRIGHLNPGLGPEKASRKKGAMYP